MAPRNDWDGIERRSPSAMEERVRMLEELDRAGSKSRAIMHTQIEEGFKGTADAVNDLGTQLQAFMLSTKGSCLVDEEPCPKADVPWLKQWLTWIGAGEVAIISFIGCWLVTH